MSIERYQGQELTLEFMQNLELEQWRSQKGEWPVMWKKIKEDCWSKTRFRGKECHML